MLIIWLKIHFCHKNTTSPTLTWFPITLLTVPVSDATLFSSHFLLQSKITLSLRLICSYLELLEVVAVARPVHLREEVLVEHLAHQLEEVNLHLVEGLVLQQAV